MVAVMKVGAK